ncbi:MAG: response regulator [Bryobacterales bacterium]|nr:response regulator [Bryobacterales bacterium]
MRYGKQWLLLLAICVSPGTAIARQVQVELKSAGATTTVFAFGPDGLHQAAPVQTDNRSVTIHTIDDLWTCPRPGSGTPAALPGLFVFGSDNAATFLDAGSICAAPNHRERIAITLQPATPVKLFIWLKSEDLKAMITDEVANANWIFRRNLVGVIFKPEFVDGLVAAPSENGETLLRRKGKSLSLPEMGCDELRGGPQDSEDFRKKDGVNIYVGFGPNFTCPSTMANPSKDIVFIQDLPVLGAAAHELAHAFGVDSPTDGDPDREYSNGHVPPTSRSGPRDGNLRSDNSRIFEANNTMWPRSMVLHDRLTLGQVYWMNFSSQSFLAQSRKAAGNSVPPLVCPNDCPRYSADYPLADPRVAARALLQPNIVGTGARLPQEVGCGELNADCPTSVLGRLNTTLQRLQAKLNMASGLANADTTFDVQFELSTGLAEDPHYCTKEELLDTLTKRFAGACASANPPLGAPGCGHVVSNGFVDFWKRNVVAAGLLEATVSLAINAEQKNGKISPDETAWNSARYRRDLTRSYARARTVIDVKPDTNLGKTLGKRILWMDSPGNNRIEQDLFRAVGIEIECSSDPRDAVQQLRDAGKLFAGAPEFSAVIANSGTGMGDDLVKELKLRNIRVPAIIYSRNITPAAKQSSLDAGAFGATDDPIELTELVFTALVKSKAP